jgi:Putative adhesin
MRVGPRARLALASGSLLVAQVAWAAADGGAEVRRGEVRGAEVRGAEMRGAEVVDRRELIVPTPGAELLRIDNPLGRVSVRAWDRAGQIHITAEKHAVSQEAIDRLRVHYTAWQSGEITVETRVELGGRERSLPLSGSRVDLVIEVPAELSIEAKTFGGDLTASGLRGGARLETTGGRIGVSDVRGGVVTRQLKGGQTVKAVDGDVDLDGVEGDLDVHGVGGGRLDARMVDGSIRAEDIRSALVRLTTTTGEILFVGLLRPSSHYDLRSYTGDVRVIVPVFDARDARDQRDPQRGFALRARSALPIESGLPMRTVWQRGDRLHAEVLPRRRVGSAAQPSPLVELSSVFGRVIIQPRGDGP